MAIGRFLAGVGAVIWSSTDNKYLILKRAVHRDFGAQSWECVAGRVEQGENFEIALHREVYEEIGLQVQVEFLLGTTHFYRGEVSPQNELVGVLYSCSTDNPASLKASAEHSEYKWVTISEANEILPPLHWLRPVLERTELLRNESPEIIRQIFRERGFELTNLKKNTL